MDDVARQSRILNRLKRLLPLFLMVAMWDGFTTIFGTVSLLGGASLGTVLIGVIVSALMLVLFYLTFDVWDDKSIDSEEVRMIFRALWIAAAVYDLFTSFYGNRALIFDSTGSAGTGGSLFVLILSTFIVSGSTLIAAWILNDDEYGNEGSGT